MKLALAQINPTVGDLAGNAAKILARYRQAAALGADLVAFPELVLTGYPPRDLLENGSFIAAVEESVKKIVAATGTAALVVGFPEKNSGAEGRPLANAAAFAAEGQLLGTYRKRLLPVYDVFDEDRYFEPGRAALPPIAWRGRRVALTICEDMWAEAPVFGRRIYREDPVAEAARGADLVLNLSASPFEIDKIRSRLEIVKAHAVKLGIPVALVNQVGGNDELVFDGTSAVVDGAGRIAALARSFEEDLVICDTDAPTVPCAFPESDPAELATRALVLGLSDYVKKCGFSKVCLGLSGGVDSAVTAVLAARALGPANVLGVLMPSRFTVRQSVDDSLALAANLGIRTRTIPIEPVFARILETLAPVFRGAPFDVTEENLQARVRGALLMAISNKERYMVLSTGNKSELSMGYCTLYGDLCGGLAVISDIPKTLVYAVAAAMNREKTVIPPAILSRPPTAELRFDQKDTDSLPPYEVLDPILKASIEDRQEPHQIAKQCGVPLALVLDVIRRVQAAEYKRRQAPPGLRVTTKAFGAGRRMPIASRWKEI